MGCTDTAYRLYFISVVILVTDFSECSWCHLIFTRQFSYVKCSQMLLYFLRWNQPDCHPEWTAVASSDLIINPDKLWAPRCSWSFILRIWLSYWSQIKLHSTIIPLYIHCISAYHHFLLCPAPLISVCLFTESCVSINKYNYRKMVRHLNVVAF